MRGLLAGELRGLWLGEPREVMWRVGEGAGVLPVVPPDKPRLASALASSVVLLVPVEPLLCD